MSTSSILLPEIQVQSTYSKAKTMILLRSRLSLKAFTAGLRIETFEQLLMALQEDHLWIMRSGTCYLKVGLTNHNGDPGQFHEDEELSHVIENLELWHRLGIRLLRCTSNRCIGENTIDFSIEHPNLQSVLLAPNNAITATFESLTCWVEFSTTKGQNDVRPRRPNKRRKHDQRRGTPGSETLVIHEDAMCSDMFHHLGEQDQKAIDDFLATTTMPVMKNDWEDWTTPPKPGFTATFDQGTPARWVEVVLELIISGRRLPAGFKVVSGVNTAPINLSAIMPGVFNTTHVKSIADRVKYIPTIAQALVRLKNAESPSLRQKIYSIEHGGNGNNGATKFQPGNGTVVEKLERRIWETAISNIRQTPLKKIHHRDWQSVPGSGPLLQTKKFNSPTLLTSSESFDGGRTTPERYPGPSWRSVFPGLDEGIIHSLDISEEQTSRDEFQQWKPQSLYPLWLDESMWENPDQFESFSSCRR